MARLITISKMKDIPPQYLDSPIGLLLKYHNLNGVLDPYTKAQLLIGMCMDNRKTLRVPDNFAYIIRSGGANLRYIEFKLSYAIAVASIKVLALIGHNNCGMVNLASKKDLFIQGLVKNAGWDKDKAEEHFNQLSPKFEIGNETDFVLNEAKRLRLMYPKIMVAPMLYKIEDNLLYLVMED